jgi:hypothetical protein
MLLLSVVQRLCSLRSSFTIIGIYSRDWIHWGVSFILYVYCSSIRIDLSLQALTLPTSPKAHLRPLGLGTLIALLMVEAYNTLTNQFAIPPPGDNTKVTMVKKIKTFSNLISSFSNTKKKYFLLLSCTIVSYKPDTSFFYFYLYS